MKLTPRWRRAAMVALALAATAMLAVTMLAAWAGHVLLDEDRFSGRISSTLSEDIVSRYLGNELANQIIAEAPDLIAVRPAIETVTIEGVRSRTARAGVRTAVREAHRAIRAGVPEESILLDLRAAFSLAEVLLERNAPDIAARLPRGLDTARIDAAVVGLRADVFDRLDTLHRLLPFFAAASVVLLAATVVVAPSRRGGVLTAAMAIAAAGALGLLAQRMTEELFIGRVPSPDEARPAVTVVWRAVLNDYRVWNLALATAGMIAAASTIASEQLPTREEIRATLVESPWARAVGGAALAVAGVAIVRWPLEALTVIAIAMGALVGLTGATLLLRSIIEGVVESRESIERTARTGRHALVPAFAGVASLGLVLLLGAWFITSLGEDEPAPPRPPITTCNGHVELCDVPLNEVVFAGTHNAMAAAAAPGWFFPNQRFTITQQLRDGIRLLLIDTYYGRQTPRGVATVIEGEVLREDLVRRHGEEVVAAWERVSARLLPGGEEGIFLCHSFCELGATPLRATLANLRDFLDAQPGEFVVIVVQDQTSPEDTVAAFERAGLAERAYAHREGEPWPTLGELLAQGKQLLVMPEFREGDVADWYQLAWRFTEENPYDAPGLDAMLCTPNRGGEGRDFFLLNHWISGRDGTPATALEINSYDFLMERVLECQRERGRLPTFIAVDFYDAGDLFQVVDELNGVPGPRAEAGSG